MSAEDDVQTLEALTGFTGGVINPTAEPTVELIPGNTYAVLNEGGGYDVQRVDDPFAMPDRVMAHSVVNTAASFIDYVLKHGVEATEVWADLERSRVIAVIDANQGAGLKAGWGAHRLTLALQHSLAWKTWTEANGRMLAQIDFANLIEDRLVDVIEPSGGVLLEIAQSFQAKTNVDFAQGERLATGEVQFKYEETTAAKAGQHGDITIPDHFMLAVKPYLGGPSYKMKARLRYKTSAQGLTLGFALERPEDILEAAFKDIVDAISGVAPVADGAVEAPHIPQTIYYGTPSN